VKARLRIVSKQADLRLLYVVDVYSSLIVGLHRWFPLDVVGLDLLLRIAVAIVVDRE